MIKLINKIGFLIHHKSVIDHIQKVLEELDVGKVDLIIEDRESSSYGNQIPSVKQLVEGFNIVPLSSAIEHMYKWKILIALHPYDSNLLRNLGFFKIRFMYGMGEGSWIFGEINKEFDLVLTHGKYASRKISKRYGVSCYIMGYPRYSNASREYDADLVNSILNVSQEDIVIIWLPTMAPHHSIRKYMSALSEFNSESVKFFVKPHPITLTSELELVAELKSLGIKILSDELSIDKYYQRADITLHDVGGTALSSLFLGKVPVFLKSDLQVLKQIGFDSPEIYLMDYCEILDLEDLNSRLALLVANKTNHNSKNLSVVKSQFFENLNENDAIIAAKRIEYEFMKSSIFLSVKKLSITKIVRKLLARLN